MGIAVTERAANEVKRVLNEQGLQEDTYLRLGVKGGGCSGLSYTIAFTESPSEDDHVLEEHGIRVLVDPKSIQFMDGIEFGFEESIVHRGFVFNNPQAERSCGCGSSFS
mgnify:CR=1 FL=1